jgi:hypothetical protein
MNDLTFDYDSLPKKGIPFIKQTTREVHLLLECSTGDIIAIGQKLIDMKARLGHGHWRAWLQTHWPLDVSLANRWMNVARKCEQLPHLKIPRSTLYLLAADSTPDTLREEFAGHRSRPALPVGLRETARPPEKPPAPRPAS